VIRLRVPGSLTYRHLAVRVVAAACKMAAPKRPSSVTTAGTDKDDSEDGSSQHTGDEFEAQTVSAFGEAFNNIAIHGYRHGLAGDIDIEIDSDESGIVIRLMDTGRSFDPASVVPPDMEDLPESGMGLFIMHSFMDEVEYSPGHPNMLRLAKRRDMGSSLTSGGGEGDEDINENFVGPPAEERVSGQSGIRMRSIARTSSQRAAGDIKIQ
jgi:serine/threonine-protein kinase RsbW